MASYYGKFNIRINCICPGGVQDKINTKNKKILLKIIEKGTTKKTC